MASDSPSVKRPCRACDKRQEWLDKNMPKTGNAIRSIKSVAGRITRGVSK